MTVAGDPEADRLPLVVVIVLNWNLAPMTIDCVDSLLESDYARLRILVVDNGSTDNSVRLLNDRYGDRITILETGENLYYAGGNNAGLRWACAQGADLCLVLNNDTLVGKKAVSLLVGTAMARLNAGIVSPLIYRGGSGVRVWSMGGVARRWILFPRELARGQTDQGQFSEPLEVDYVTGCAMMIRRTTLDQVGLFSTDYRMYYEDADYCVRVRRSGLLILAEPRAKVWHRVSASGSKDSALSRYHRVRHRLRFYRSHYAGTVGSLACLFIVAHEACRAMLALTQGQTSVARAAARGLRDGLQDADTAVREPHVVS